MLHGRQLTSRLPELVCVSLVVMWGQGSEVTASPQPLKEATFKTLPVSDVMFTEDVLWEKPARSRLECSVMCRGDGQCLMVTFQPGTHGTPGSCRSHGKQQNSEGQQKTAPGAQSLYLLREIWIQKACSSNNDCTEPMAACNSGQCLCDKGYFFDYRLNACVSACSRSLSDTYLEYKCMDFKGRDMYKSYSYDEPMTCQTRCNSEPTCVIFTTSKTSLLKTSLGSGRH